MLAVKRIHIISVDAVLTSAKYSLFRELEAEFNADPVEIPTSVIVMVSHVVAHSIRHSYRNSKVETDNVKYEFESKHEYGYPFEEMKEKV